MNRKQLVILIIVGVIFGAVGLNLSRKQEATWKTSAQKMGEKLFPNFDVNQVEALSIKSPTASVALAKKNDQWVVTDRSNYPANFGTLHDFLIKVLELKVAQPVRASGSQLERLELVTPDKGTNAGTLVEFKDKGGKSLTSLLLGKKHVKDSPGNSQFGGGAYPNGRYVMAGGSKDNIALVSEAFANVEPKAEEWLDKDFLKVEKLRSIALTSPQPTNSWKLTRETESGEWKLADATADEKLDSGKASGMNYLLSSPSFHDVAASDKKPEETGLDKPTVAKLETFEDFTYTVKVGKADTDSRHYLQISTAAEIPSTRTPGKDEKPEDKDKLDKEFKEKNQKLAEKLKKEQSANSWVYLVDKWTVENLLKERHQLMAEKKAEEQKEASPAPSTPILDPLQALPKLNP